MTMEAVDYFDHLYCTEELHQFCSTVHGVVEVEEVLENHDYCKMTMGGKCISHVQVVEAVWQEGNEWRKDQFKGCHTEVKTITFPALDRNKTCDLCLEPMEPRDYSRKRINPHNAHLDCVDRLTHSQYRQWINRSSSY